MPRLDPEILTAFATSIFEASELPPDMARQVAESLVLANLSGNDSHGVIRILEYVAWTKRGWVNPNGQLTVLHDPWNLYLMACPNGFAATRHNVRAWGIAPHRTTHLIRGVGRNRSGRVESPGIVFADRAPNDLGCANGSVRG